MANTTKPEPGTRQADLWLAGWETGFQAGLADEEPTLPPTAEGLWKDGWLQGNLDAGWERLAQMLGGGETGPSLKQHAHAHRSENRAALHSKMEAAGIQI